MAIQSLKFKLDQRRKGIKSTKSNTGRSDNNVNNKKQPPPSIELLNYDTTSLFESIPSFTKLHLNDFNADTYDDDDGEDGDDQGSDVVPDESCQVLTECIGFLLNLKYETLSKYKMTKQSRVKLINSRLKYPKIIILNQLYTMIPNYETEIDSKLEKLSNKYKLLKIIPVTVSASMNNLKLIILKNDLINLIRTNQSLNEIEKISFVDLINTYPNLNQVSSHLLDTYKLSSDTLIQSGFLTISTITDSYNLSLPNLGPTLKMVKVGIEFIMKSCKTQGQGKGQGQCCLESELLKKFSESIGNNADGVAFKNGIFIKTNGLNPIWLLSIMVGCGLLEIFNSPVGKVYKLTGKRLS